MACHLLAISQTIVIPRSTKTLIKMSSDHHFIRTLKDNIVISGDNKVSSTTLGKQNENTDAAMPPNQ